MRQVLVATLLLWASWSAAQQPAPLECTTDKLASDCPSASTRTDDAFVSVADVQRRLLAGERLHLVDVRPESVGTIDRIPSALSVSPLKLRTMSFWKAEPIVLIGSGAAYRSLLALRDELHGADFIDVHVLDGGARFWRTGVDRFAHQASDSLLAPGAFDLVTDAARWTVLEIESQAPRLLPDVRRVSLQVDSPERVAQAALSALPRGRGLVSNVLVVARDENLAAKVAERLQRRGRANVFALQGGWAAWEEGQLLRDRLLAASAAGTRAHAGGVCW